MDELRASGAWLGNELQALIGWLREPGMWAGLLAGLVLWSLAYQATPPQTLYLGGDLRTHRRGYDTPFLADSFNDPEPAERAGLEWWRQLATPYPYRWASEDATVLLPGLGGGGWAVSVLASSGRPDGSAVESRWRIGDGATVPLTIGATWRRYTIAGPATAGDLRLTIKTPPFRAPNDPRSLGLVIHQITASAVPDRGPRAPAAGQLALLAACTAVCYGLARRLSAARRWALALALAVAVLFAALLVEQRLVLAAFAPALAGLAGACYLLTIVLAPLLAAGATALGLAVPRAERDAALGTTIGAFGLRMAGLLHPYAISSDLGLNINNLAQIIRGDIFITEGLPCEAGLGQAPYPPAQYLVLAPLRLLLGADERQLDLLVQAGNALLESSSAALVWLLLRRVGLGRRAALLGATLYVTAPPLLRSFSVGEFANLFAQSLLVPLLLFLVLGAPRAVYWRVVAPGAVLLLAIALSHTGMTISVAALLAVWTPLWWLSRPRGRRPWPLLAGGVLAALVALALFYSSFADLVLAPRAQAAEQPPAAGERCPPGYPLGDKLIWTAQAGFGPGGSLSPALLAVGGAGALWLWRHHRARLDLALLACWAGTLLSLGTLLTSDQVVRWQPFLFPALCLGGGPILAAWMRRGRAGALLALATLGYLLWFGLDFWIHQVGGYLH